MELFKLACLKIALKSFKDMRKKKGTFLMVRPKQAKIGPVFDLTKLVDSTVVNLKASLSANFVQKKKLLSN